MVQQRVWRKQHRAYRGSLMTYGIPKPCSGQLPDGSLCDELTLTGRCDEHLRDTRRRPSATQRGYNSSWQRVSKRARRLQPWCSDQHLGGCKGPIQADHTGPDAWARQAKGLPLRLGIDVDVTCQAHNIARGAARGEHVTR